MVSLNKCSKNEQDFSVYIKKQKISKCPRIQNYN